MKRIIILLLGLISWPAMADNCDKPRDDFDGLYCLNKIYLQADQDLNLAYQELRSYLTNEQKKRLKRTQLKWIDSRNKNCGIRKNNKFYVNLKCTTMTTRHRVNALQDRIRECKATGCRTSRL